MGDNKHDGLTSHFRWVWWSCDSACQHNFKAKAELQPLLLPRNTVCSESFPLPCLISHYFHLPVSLITFPSAFDSGCYSHLRFFSCLKKPTTWNRLNELQVTLHTHWNDPGDCQAVCSLFSHEKMNLHIRHARSQDWSKQKMKWVLQALLVFHLGEDSWSKHVSRHEYEQKD